MEQEEQLKVRDRYKDAHVDPVKQWCIFTVSFSPLLLTRISHPHVGTVSMLPLETS